MIGEIIGDLLTACGIWLGGDAGLRRAAGRMRNQGMLLGALRVHQGDAAGLSKRWRVREIIPSKGSLAFGSNQLPVVAVYRRAELGSLTTVLGNRLPPPVAFFDVQSETAQLELAVLVEDADGVSRTLGSARGGA
jgi:hypothetical protein